MYIRDWVRRFSADVPKKLPRQRISSSSSSLGASIHLARIVYYASGVERNKIVALLQSAKRYGKNGLS